jgi:hypothetical protein
MTTSTEITNEADPTLPIIRMTGDFTATSGQLFRAYTGPVLFAKWIAEHAPRG